MSRQVVVALQCIAGSPGSGKVASQHRGSGLPPQRSAAQPSRCTGRRFAVLHALTVGQRAQHAGQRVLQQPDQEGDERALG